MSDISLASRLQAAIARRTQAKPVSFFEFWPGAVFYAPVALFWIAQALRHRSLTLPALANPRIEAGGICGESKNDILDLAGAEARRWIAPYIGITTQGLATDADLAMAEAAMAEAGLAYPVVAKPDMSCNGAGVRLVETSADLARYLAEFPRATRLQLQALVPHEGEAGIFYIRHPDETRGRITSVTLKYAPMVTGDGRSRIRDLIAADARLNSVSHLLLPKLGAQAARIPAQGERARLVFVGNHCRGSTFKDGRHLITQALTDRIDAIARDIPEFHFGRFDLRFASPNALRRGEDFSIIEVNGAGSEATHIWDPETSIVEAYRTQFFHYGTAFRIGAAMRKRGTPRYGAWRLFGIWQRQKALMAQYPTND
ncbi:D-alanine--D-alanine ligase [Acidiphilium iwatense]|uniref:D-alanine--D-alanine ligase n=1 Tax=Acidiphilium iwatense TaxID=768198 RepID=A0ABS9DZK2_9PROT|nr:D-alanine--D-alanine ligase [Acidiphilium iwatense]MCF3946857.1 D-alanine--D-alanine ligase [Acidiphilium iwatense]